MKIHKKKLFTLIGMTLCLRSIFGSTTTLASDNFFNILHSTQASSKGSKQLIVEGFCNTIINNPNTVGINQEQAKQSLFLMLLCTHNTLGSNEQFFKSDEGASTYKKTGYSFKKSKFSSNCTSKYKENCNIAELTDNLLTQILSEYFIIKEADLFGVTSTGFESKKAMQDLINNFTTNILGVPEESFCKDEKYKTTCKMLESQMKQFKKPLKNLEIIDTTILYQKANEDKNHKQCGTDEAIREKLIYCGLIGEQSKGLNTFIELVYNELQRYTLFSIYYSDTLSQTENTKKIKNEYIESLNGPEKFNNLVLETLGELSNIKTTYPIHVLLVAYQENLINFRDKYLSKIVTPIYCLYHKFRNVQRKK